MARIPLSKLPEASLAGHSELYRWMLEHAADLERAVSIVGRPNWPALARTFGEDGLTDRNGNPPNPEQSPESESAPFIPVPAAKPDPGADPETLANSQGGLDREASKRLTTKVPVSTVSALPPDQRKVRVVGPAFLPDPSAAIDLKAPAPQSAQ